ncbi:MAG: GNAT family N-acetyltransferase [Sphingomonadaceae bacterium]
MLPVGYQLIDDQAQIDPIAAHAYLTTSYWSSGIPLETVKQALAGSFCVAIQKEGAQLAFARVVTDYATFAYLADVYVLEAHRGHGLAQAMLRHLQAHERLQGLRRWALFTHDAQPLYAKLGWGVYPHPERLMTLDALDVYS